MYDSNTQTSKINTLTNLAKPTLDAEAIPASDPNSLIVCAILSLRNNYLYVL